MDYTTMAAKLAPKEQKATIFAKITADANNIVLTIPRKMLASELRTGDKSVFACVQAEPGNGVSLEVTDEATGKIMKLPVTRKVNLNLFGEFRKHEIIGKVADAKA